MAVIESIRKDRKEKRGLIDALVFSIAERAIVFVAHWTSPPGLGQPFILHGTNPVRTSDPETRLTTRLIWQAPLAFVVDLPAVCTCLL